MSEEEMLSNFEGITLRMEMNQNVPKVTTVQLFISVTRNWESNDQVNILLRSFVKLYRLDEVR